MGIDMEPSSQNLGNYSSNSTQDVSYSAEPQLAPPYFMYQFGQPLDPFFAINTAPFQPVTYTPINSAPQSNIRTQQQSPESATAKRRKLDCHDESIIATAQAKQFSADQLPSYAFEPRIPTAVSEPTLSQCCSSCSEGPPCDEPGCEDQREKVVPCMETDCEASVCTDKCIYPAEQALGSLGFVSDPQRLTSSAKLSNWDETMWSKIMSTDTSQDYVDSNGVLNGTGELFGDAQLSQFPRQCEWSSCGQLMQTPEECLQHLHEMHFDPQMIFNCPTEMPSCQETIVNPLDHLTAKHGWTIPTYGEDDFRQCPAPSCQENEAYMDPQQLHNHFDEVHSTPIEGGLHCKWSACSTIVNDSHALFTHLNEQHQLPVPVTGLEDIDLTPDNSNSSHLSCKWVTKSGQSCAKVCANETELHEHVKSDHLQTLEKEGGYFCHWEDCRRNMKLGDKRGFSQKGKLERHIASHTGCKLLSIF